MRVEVEVPTEHQGDILGDLNRRRARVLGMDTRGDIGVVQAHAPLAELFGYTGGIRSLSRGRASATMTPSHFDPVPKSVAEEVLAK
jgi:elongation factor G